MELDLNNPADLAEAKRLLSGGTRTKREPLPRDVPTLTGNRWCIAVPGHTSRLNELMQSVGARIGKKRRDRELIAECVLASGIPAATGKRWVRLTVVLERGQRAADPDAWQKSLGDSLVHCGVLKNDSPAWVVWHPVEYARGQRRCMFIELGDATCNS